MDGQNSLNQYLNTEIVCTLAGLGCAEGTEYFKGPDCLESLKDLIKFLRSDDSTCEIRRQLGYSEVLQNDLVAILKSCTPKETEIFDITIRLMVNLTQPAVLCFNEKMPEDKTGRHYYMDLVTQLQAYKEAFTDKEVFEVIGREVGRILQLEWDDRQEEDYLLLERILLLLRNILHVPADPQAEKRTDDDASIHDQVLWNFHVNGLDDLLLYVASSPDERRWSMHVLEIIFLMLREQNAESLAKAGYSRTSSEKDEDAKQLEILRARELAEKKKNVMKFSGRHSRFGGTFYVHGMKAIERHNYIYHKPLTDAKNMTFDTDKERPRRRKAEMAAKEIDVERRSTLSIRLYLKEFCAKFLEHCYNPLLNTVRDNLLHKRTQENDESYFLWAMRFFMEFSRHYNFRVDYVGETMSVANFSYVLSIITKFYDCYTGKKEEAITWSRRLHLAVKAYKELIMYVKYMSSSKDENLQHISRIIKGNIFYIVEYREIFIMLLRKFNYSKQSRAYLRDLVEAFHIFLKMLESYSDGKNHLLVQKKNRKKTKKKKKSTQARSINLTAEEIEEKWQSLTADLSALLQGRAGAISECTAPFDAASEIPVDEQRTLAVAKIQNLLRHGQIVEAVATLRAARDVWPGDPFGEADIGSEDEFMCLYEIFRMDVPQVNVPNEDNYEDGADEDEIDAEEEEIEAVAVRETEFDIRHELKRLAHSAILEPYWWLLQFYKENSMFTNHCIIKMMHRVAVDLRMFAMFFQLSLFCTFKKILFDPAAHKYKEMVKFAKFILAKFFELLPKNPVLLAEVIVWKSTTDCCEITEGYGFLAQREVKRGGCSWSYEDEQELEQLFEEHKDSEDFVDTIVDNLSNPRTRRQVANKLFSMQLVADKKLLRKKAKKKGVWTEEENEQLSGLYQEHKDTAEDVVDTIVECMGATRSRRQVIIQLVRLGIVQDRKSLRKKKKKTKRKKQTEEDDDEIEEEDHQGNSSEEDDFNNAVTSDDSSSDSEDNGDDIANNAPLSTIINRLVEIGLKEQLQWIQGRLRRTAEDRETEDNWEPVPLVTITEENENALNNRLFRRALKKVGIVPPASEQETFWRIPSSLSPEQLRKAADQLDLSNEEGIEGVAVSPDFTRAMNSKNGARKEKLAALAAAQKTSASKKKRGEKPNAARNRQETRQRAKNWRSAHDTAGGDSENESSEDEPLSAIVNKSRDINEFQHETRHAQESGATKQKRRIQAFEDSEDDEPNTLEIAPQIRDVGVEGEGTEDKENREDFTGSTQKPRRKFTNFNDSDEEPLSETIDNLNNDRSTMNSYSPISTIDTSKKRRREDEQTILEDDDEEEFSLPLSHYKKARRIMIEDEDE